NIVSRDTWTTEDKLGYELYAKAITESILTEDTKAPLTVGIQAPWGQGKTSLMRMMQERLDKGSSLRDQEVVKPLSIRTAITTTYRELIDWTKNNDAAPVDGMIPVTKREDGRSHLPTIWFNPLYYRETSQVWAGMAHAIVNQLVARLGLKERELFWFRLQQSRINTEAIRRDVHHRILLRFVPLGIVLTALFVLTLTVMAVFPTLAGAIASAISLAGGVGVFGIFKKVLEQKPIDTPFEKYVTEPNYKSELGLLHLIDEDLDRALGLLVGSRPIAVFIDDLDRCDPQTVNQVILAINQFLSLPRRNVFFFLGMDMDMVAAALEQAQKDQGGGRGTYRRSFGWRFMEKFVQLPFVIPHLEPAHAQKFAEAYLGSSRSAPAAFAAPIAPKEELLKQVQDAPTASALGAVVAALPADAPPDVVSVVQEAASTRAAVLMRSNDSEEMQAIAQVAVQDLELNPRTIVRYFCLVRVLRNIQIATGKSEDADTDRKLVLRAAHLLMNWPQFVQWLRNEPQVLTAEGEWKSTVEEIEELAKNKKTMSDWTDGMKPLVRGEVPMYLADASLYRFLARICTDGPGLERMYAARMF
ncbi:MAG TPA: P-loop NTPase fold protein, partial [Thermoanaerobaculia bacterium]|nr:P-loop NTPase fold protein [Thermoanaerobaculia bacterium]